MGRPRKDKTVVLVSATSQSFRLSKDAAKRIAREWGVGTTLTEKRRERIESAAGRYLQAVNSPTVDKVMEAATKLAKAAKAITDVLQTPEGEAVALVVGPLAHDLPLEHSTSSLAIRAVAPFVEVERAVEIEFNREVGAGVDGISNFVFELACLHFDTFASLPASLAYAPERGKQKDAALDRLIAAVIDTLPELHIGKATQKKKAAQRWRDVLATFERDHLVAGRTKRTKKNQV